MSDTIDSLKKIIETANNVARTNLLNSEVRKQAEELIKKSVDKLDKVLEALPDTNKTVSGVFVSNRDYTPIEEINRPEL